MISSDDRKMTIAIPVKQYQYHLTLKKFKKKIETLAKATILQKNTSAHEKYLIQMCSQAKSSSIRLPEVHGVQKELDPNLRPEKQHTMSKQGKLERLQVGQGRAGLRRRKPYHINQPIIQPLDVTQGIP